MEIRRVICSTNGNESLNARYRRVVRACGHFPTIPAALNASTARMSMHGVAVVRRRQGRRRNVCPESSALQMAEH
ncbi:transposase [Arthrobacter oryzae]|uniref:transposase n=1 Tax=Arthrobacter oryzae TaxID=409290 RepID=UPI0037BE4304